MTTPNISEAARRAAEAVLGGALNYDTSLESVQNDELPAVAAIIQYVIDSAHPAPKERLPVVDQMAEDDATKRYDIPSGIVRPAPKEGETPETDAESREFDRRHCDGSDYAPPSGQYVRKSFARSLELRLAEAMREVARLQDLCVNGAGAACLTELRAQLQKANELLGRTVITMSIAAERDKAWCDWPLSELRERIRTHLNQQSK